jgi:N-acetylglutamate synthase-like GNAT family acetyltransferase
MELVIRKASDKDLSSILNLLYELKRPQPLDVKEVRIFKKKIKDYLTDSNKAILVAEHEKKIVGMLSVIYLQRLNHTKLEMYIPELVVTERLRYFGIGKKLVDYCIELAKKKKCYRIRLESGNQRKESHKFYKSIGFDQSALTFTKNIVIMIFCLMVL